MKCTATCEALGKRVCQGKTKIRTTAGAASRQRRTACLIQAYMTIARGGLQVGIREQRTQAAPTSSGVDRYIHSS